MSRLCNFVPSNGKYKCELCGYITKWDNAIRECDNQPPNYIQKIINFTGAYSEHRKYGSPTVSEEQVKERLDICIVCPLFKSVDNGVNGVCTHNTCGCNITDSVEFFNKLAWADQKCPLDKWEPILPSGQEP